MGIVYKWLRERSNCNNDDDNGNNNNNEFCIKIINKVNKIKIKIMYQ